MAIISFKTSCRICNYIRWKDIKGWTDGDDDDIYQTPPPLLLASIKDTESRLLWNTARYYKCAVIQGKTSRCLRRLIICVTDIHGGIEKFLITYCFFFSVRFQAFLFFRRG